jgi:hypothetical protein
MNQAGDRIVVNGVEGDKSFVVSNATATPNGGLQVNERVTVNYTERNGRLVAFAVGMPQPYRVSKEMEEHFREEIEQNQNRMQPEASPGFMAEEVSRFPTKGRRKSFDFPRFATDPVSHVHLQGKVRLLWNRQ